MVQTAENAKTALDMISKEQPDIVLTDIQMPDMDGLALLAEIRKRVPEILVILLTAYGSLKTAVEGIKAGAFDYMNKPFILDEIRLTVRRGIDYQQILRENQSLREQLRERYRLDSILGMSPAMVSVYKLIARVAQTDTTVLIQGESGTGKELVARAIHSHSLRNTGPFVAVDCGTFAENLLESELFGHERGAFTGAVGAKKGLFEVAHSGTCFLDEIGGMTSTLQSKLLRVLQEHEIRRVGGMKTIPVNVRIVAASNKALGKKVEAGEFREDLYYRLNVVMIELPPLRERPEDIPILANYFLQKYGETGTKGVNAITPEAMELLVRYLWPGNVRELEHTIERAIVLTPHSMILPEDLPPPIRFPSRPTEKSPRWKTLDELEREHILHVLEVHQGDETLTAEILGIHRKTLLRKLREYGRA